MEGINEKHIKIQLSDYSQVIEKMKAETEKEQ